MKSEKRITQLNRFAFNARVWREENGLTTPEWEQYTEWQQVRKLAALTIGYLAGFAFGIYVAVWMIVV